VPIIWLGLLFQTESRSDTTFEIRVGLNRGFRWSVTTTIALMVEKATGTKRARPCAVSPLVPWQAQRKSNKAPFNASDR